MGPGEKIACLCVNGLARRLEVRVLHRVAHTPRVWRLVLTMGETQLSCWSAHRRVTFPHRHSMATGFQGQVPWVEISPRLWFCPRNSGTCLLLWSEACPDSTEGNSCLWGISTHILWGAGRMEYTGRTWPIPSARAYVSLRRECFSFKKRASPLHSLWDMSSLNKQALKSPFWRESDFMWSLPCEAVNLWKSFKPRKI